MSYVPDFKDREGNWVMGYNINRSKHQYTKLGQLHADMLKRCTEGSAEQLRHTHYQGCYMSEDFKDTNKFGEWATQQVGYREHGYQLDKDILIRGNKLYSAETCVFVHNALNKFLTKREVHRGDTPIGVHWKTKNQKYQASMTVDGKSVYLGLFVDPLDGHRAYKAAKEEEAKRLAGLYRGKVDERVYEALMNYQVEITD